MVGLHFGRFFSQTHLVTLIAFQDHHHVNPKKSLAAQFSGK
jgi:hypothetical protein